MELVVPTPPGFNFRRTVLSHGWAFLPPFEFDRETWILRRVVTLAGRKPMVAAFEGVPRGIRVTAEPARMSARGVADLAAQVTAIFNLDADLSPFYRRAAKVPGFGWVAGAGAGRLLRAPTVWEDVVKLVLTTNCAWSSTVRMVGAVVALGEPAHRGRRAFPGPGAVAAAGEPFLRDTVRAGYRARPLATLAAAVADGSLDLESWPKLTAEEIRASALRLPGCGPYVADNLVGVLGQRRGLGVDAWVRKTLSTREGRSLSDTEIRALYEDFGDYAGTALWCDITRDAVDGSLAGV